ncbi:MAG: hypothetical protein WAP20_01115 [Limnochordia bacterium]
MRNTLPDLDIMNCEDASCFIVGFHKAYGGNPNTQEKLGEKLGQGVFSVNYLIKTAAEMAAVSYSQMIDLQGLEPCTS